MPSADSTGSVRKEIKVGKNNINRAKMELSKSPENQSSKNSTKVSHSCLKNN